ncbi:BlaI/MecI/CopY family transcriptional regulator [Roseivirga sp. E12]|uniref:BlaI/MecI/CopY family transcriptional regulator n=1 Tax=Roseivirga sp. E12 TaxID=2819237 RepID=UPI001ABC8555|nr:BlaI/MecI/CopY family transcriptional regulator [Roseivirga sp. E12]MBO3700292.1 BlaI/MecI/CopY family transcriptional regulator [Roseivirga sp. E12]
MDVQPTNSELEVLTVLWELGSGTAREVHEELAKTKSTGYTTTLKIIQNMFDKGFLTREPKGQTHIYYSAVEQQVIQKQMLGGFVNKVFSGSSQNLILQALGNQKPNKDELDEIRAMLDELENKKK